MRYLSATSIIIINPPPPCSRVVRNVTVNQPFSGAACRPDDIVALSGRYEPNWLTERVHDMVEAVMGDIRRADQAVVGLWNTLPPEDAEPTET
jgi:hypothetical protein